MNLEEEITRKLIYDKDSGKLFWKERSENSWVDRRFNRNFAGKEAGTFDKRGYKVVKICGVNLFCHRLVWFFHYKKWPSKNLDHINGKKSCNLISNLREADQGENLKNCKIRSDNTSGQVGVYFNKSRNKWRASIVVSGENIHLGYFKNKDDAINARKSAEIEHNFHKNHGRGVA